LNSQLQFPNFRSDPSECTWSGRWMSAFSAHNIYCRCDNHGHCGHLECSVNHFNYHAQNSTEISGDRCDQISLFGFEGKATCGYIAWFDNSETLVDNWYKSK
uniref:Polyprotein n=1 Tax=Brugia timori TaxID=42155 RepID=A0A0R3Q6C9_9BILA